MRFDDVVNSIADGDGVAVVGQVGLRVGVGGGQGVGKLLGLLFFANKPDDHVKHVFSEEAMTNEPAFVKSKLERMEALLVQGHQDGPDPWETRGSCAVWQSMLLLKMRQCFRDSKGILAILYKAWYGPEGTILLLMLLDLTEFGLFYAPILLNFRNV